MRSKDIIKVQKLIHECIELGDDPVSWQRHLVRGIMKLINARFCVAGPLKLPFLAKDTVEYSDIMLDGDWESEETRQKWQKWITEPNLPEHPALIKFTTIPGERVVRTRRELVSDEEWEKSSFVQEQLRPDGSDDGIVSRQAVPVASIKYMICPVRGTGQKPFGERESVVMQLIQDYLEPRLGRELLLSIQPNVSKLSHRLRSVLDMLLLGLSEKEITLRLSLSRGTVHDYIKKIYRHFNVTSRPELMSYFLRRYRPYMPMDLTDPTDKV
jgi:DNA-binding CsgD family transcriptional regulator